MESLRQKYIIRRGEPGKHFEHLEDIRDSVNHCCLKLTLYVLMITGLIIKEHFVINLDFEGLISKNSSITYTFGFFGGRLVLPSPSIGNET